MGTVLEGKPIALKLAEGLRREISSLKYKLVLASIQVGDNAGASSYIKSQIRVSDDLGVTYVLYSIGQDAREAEVADLIQRLNTDISVHGIILQMPLSAQMDYKRLRALIALRKDVEGMHPENIGKLFFGQTKIIPCTPAAIMELLKNTGVDLKGKETVIVGHSEIVGKPLALLLLEKLSTVTICHIGTYQAGQLQEHVAKAEVLVVAVGKPGLIKGEWIKNGAVVIDVGINRVNERIVGDVEFETAQARAAFITPVPGGVGPLTVMMLMRNLLEAATSASSQ